MYEVAIGLIFMVALIVLFFSGLELAFAMGIVAVAGYAYLISPSAAMNMAVNDIFDSLQSYGMTVVPLFMLMGQIAFHAGMAKRLYDSANKFVGHVPGGLAIATIAGTTIFKAICGSSGATVATFASVAIPEMERFGFDKKLSAGLVAATGTIGMLIPPSVVLIVLGIITQQSIGRVFLAGAIPGLMLSFLFVFVVLAWCTINPTAGPRSEKSAWDARLKTVPQIIWPLVIFTVMIGGLMAGFFTPTEAGSIGAFAILILTVSKKDIGFSGIVASVKEALRASCMILLLIAFSTSFGHFIAATNIPNYAGQWIVTLPLHRHLLAIIIFAVYLVGGSFIDDLAFCLMATPIFFPLFLKLGYDPVWVCVMLALTVSIGTVIPPVAVCVFIVQNITKLPIKVIYRGVYPFLAGLVLVAVLLFIFPGIALWLPSILMK
jgi:C4-dicarboxylate transporter, DctM subunit